MSDLGHLHCGQSPASSTVNTNGVGTSYVTGPEQWDGWQFHTRKWTTDPKRIVPEGCIFITVKGGGVGKIFPGVAAAIGRDIYAFEPKPSVSRKFVEHALRASVNEVLRHAAGDIPGLSKAHILDHEISLPSLTEQEQVVAEIEKQFSRLDEAVAGLKRVKANLKRYKAAVLKAAVEGRLVETEADLARREGRDYETGAQLLQRILATRRQQWQGKGKYKEPAAPDTADLPELPEGWAWAPSDALFEFVTSGSRGWAAYYSDSGARFIRVGNLDHGTIDLDLRDVQHVQPPTGPEADRSRVKAGDLLISITAELGMIAVAPDSLGEAYINQHVAIARPTVEIDRKYLGWYFACEHAGKRQLESLRRGATKAGLGLDDVRAVWVAMPPLPEQHRIVAEVDRLLSIAREAEAEVEANLKRAQALRQAILARAFQPSAVAPAPTFGRN